MNRWAWLLALLALAACGNLTELIRVGPVPTPSPTPTTPPATVPPTPCVVPTVGPAPNITALLDPALGNWDKAVGPLADPYDNDGNVFLLVWLCTVLPQDPYPPHEVLWKWDLSCCDGDQNTPFTPPDFSLPCCAYQP